MFRFIPSAIAAVSFFAAYPALAHHNGIHTVQQSVQKEVQHRSEEVSQGKPPWILFALGSTTLIGALALLYRHSLDSSLD